MARRVPVELEVARAAYSAALDRWLADPYREQVYSRSRLELGAASRRLTDTLRELGVPPRGVGDGEHGFGVGPWAC